MPSDSALSERAAQMRREVLRMDLGESDGVNVAEEMAVARLPAVLDQIDLIDLDPRIRILALRVSAKSAYQWRRRWRAGGAAALACRGAGGAVCRLSPAQLARLRAELDKGPAAWGWAEDQRWTLERAATLIGRLFHVRYTLRARRACCTGWGRRRPAPGPARPHPVVAVSGKGSGRVSAAGMTCCRPRARSRFFYRIRVHTGRKGERRSMSEADHEGLITAARTQLHAPLILCWDNLKAPGRT